MTRKLKEMIESVLGEDVVSESELIAQHGDPYLTPGSRIIMVRGNKTCAQCGKVDETRPYGPKAEELCFACATKDDKAKAVTERQMKRVLFGDTEQ